MVFNFANLRNVIGTVIIIKWEIGCPSSKKKFGSTPSSFYDFKILALVKNPRIIEITKLNLEPLTFVDFAKKICKFWPVRDSKCVKGSQMILTIRGHFRLVAHSPRIIPSNSIPFLTYFLLAAYS